MFQPAFTEVSESILALTLGMARLYPCLFLVPAFAFREIKGMLRHAIVLALALVPMPGIRASLTGHDLGLDRPWRAGLEREPDRPAAGPVAGDAVLDV